MSNSISVREFVKMTTDQRPRSETEDDEVDEQVNGDTLTPQLPSTSSSGANVVTGSSVPPAPRLFATTTTHSISSSSSSQIPPTTTMARIESESTTTTTASESRPGAYAVAPGNRITQLAASKSLSPHHSHRTTLASTLTTASSSASASIWSHHRPNVSPSSSPLSGTTEPHSSNNAAATSSSLSTEEIITMLRNTRTYTDDEAMASTLQPPVLSQPSDDTSSSQMIDHNHNNQIPNHIHDNNDDDDENHTELSRDDPAASSPESPRPETSPSHHWRSSTTSSSVPVAHLVPISEEDTHETTHLTIVGTPYLEEEEEPRNRNQAKWWDHKVRFITCSMAVAIILLLAVVLGSICGVTDSCGGGGGSVMNVTTPEPVVLDARAMDMQNYINQITLSNRTIGYPPSTRTMSGRNDDDDKNHDDTFVAPEELALQWLIEIDPMPLWANRSDHWLPIRQRYALQTLYAATTTKKSSWINDQGWKPGSADASNECDWFGVNCTTVAILDRQENLVTGLALSQNELHGPVPPDIGLLSDFTHVDLSYNHLCGPLPASIGQWQFLEHLVLSGDAGRKYCWLNGTIPSTIGNWKGPISVDLSGNNFSGTLPSSLANWNATRLQKFILRINRIEGTIPSYLVTWWNLTQLEMDQNQLTGTIPDSIGNLRQLQTMILNYNLLNGTLPLSIENLTQIQYFSVHSNYLTGNIPVGISSTWTNLRYAELEYNDFMTTATVADGPICRRNNDTSAEVRVYLDCPNTTGITATENSTCSCCECRN